MTQVWKILWIPMIWASIWSQEVQDYEWQASLRILPLKRATITQILTIFNHRYSLPFFWDTLYHQYANVGRRGGLSHKALWDLLLAVKQFIQVTEILLRWWEGIWQVMGHLNICNTVHIHPHIQIRVLVSHLSQNIHKPANILQTSYWRTKFSEHFPCNLNQN